MGNPTLKIDFPVTYLHTCLVVKLPERLTFIESISLKRSCSELIKQNKAGKKIILDFEDTQFIDSGGIGALIGIQMVARAYKQKLILQQVQLPIMMVLEMTRLTEVFQIQYTE